MSDNEHQVAKSLSKQEYATKYVTDNDGVTPLRMWSNARDGNHNFTSAVHLVSRKTGDSLCGRLKNTGVGFPAEPEDGMEAITCRLCVRIAGAST